MRIRVGGDPDRLIKEVYVWIVTDTKTGLEGIFSMNTGIMDMQCAPSSKEMALRIGETIRELPYNDKKFRLVRFLPAEVITEV